MTPIPTPPPAEAEEPIPSKTLAWEYHLPAYIDEDQPPSAAFLAAVCGSASPVAACEWCGRIHFAASGDGMEPGELERLKDKERMEPAVYFEQPVDAIDFGDLLDLQYVAGCPCNRAARIERLLWDLRFVAGDYLKARTRQESLSAQMVERLVEELPTLLTMHQRDAAEAAELGEVKWVRCGLHGCILKRGHDGNHYAEPPEAPPSMLPPPEPLPAPRARPAAPIDQRPSFRRVCASCATEFQTPYANDTECPRCEIPF